MKIVVVGPGVIGSIYRGLLVRSGHDVTLIARGQRLAALRAHGLVLEDADSGQRTEISLPVLDELSPDDRSTWCWCRSALSSSPAPFP